MATRFLILAAPRTGTNRLVEQLCSQPDVWCHREVLARGKVPIKRAGEQLKEKLLNLRERDFDAFVERIFKISKGRPHCGIKILLAQMDEQPSSRILDDAGIAKIVLFRTNILASYASLLAAKKSGAWSPTRMAGAKRPLVEFKPARFGAFRKTYTDRYDAVSARLAASGQSPFLIDTPELNNSARIAELLAFLGAGTRVIEPDFPSSRGSSDILSRFSNPDIVRRYLQVHDVMHWTQEMDAMDIAKAPSGTARS